MDDDRPLGPLRGLEEARMTSGYWFWLAVGFTGQFLFTARFLVQWLASERKREVVVPRAFWWLSIMGGAALLSYAISRRDPVIILGQSMGLFVYARNLMLGSKAEQASKSEAGSIAAMRPHVAIGSASGRRDASVSRL